MKIDSPHWDRENGVCEKHLLPQIPCLACLAGDGDEDLEFTLTDMDEAFLEGENALRAIVAEAAGDIDEEGNPIYTPMTLKDLLPGSVKKR